MPRTAPLAAALAACLAAAATAVLAFGTSATAATLFSDDFNDGNSSGWSQSGGTWSVVTDGTPALRQSKVDSDLARLFAGTTTWTDYTVEARVKPLGFDGADRFLGLVARSSGSTSFDRLVLRNTGRAELQAVRSGAVTVLGSLPLTVTTGTWYTLRLEASGGTIRGFVNGVAAGSGSSQSATGRIGVQTFRATGSFDDVIVTTGGTTPSPSASTSVSPPASPSASPSSLPSQSPPAAGLYVAVNGNDANPGTIAAPLATVHRAVTLAQPGTTIQVRGGTYLLATNIQLLKSGTAASPITITAYNGEKVVLDGENLPYTPGAVDSSIPRADRGAIHIEGEYWRLIGLEIVHGAYGIFGVDTSYNVFDRLTTRDNYESGLHLQGASGNNQILNLDSYGNRDPRKNGESADGLAIKEGSGTGNVVRGARLWNNSDDGFDAWEFLSPVVIESSVAYGNGYNRWNIPDYTGDGNGFKLGGGDVDLPAAHVVRNSMAWSNSAGGFIDNANPGAMVIERSTSWRNGGNGFDFADADATLTRNVSAGNGTAVSLGSNSSGSGNSWDLGGTWNDASFTSTNAATITGARTASGSIPGSNFLWPANGADAGARL
ncbi:hypothetical protein F4553_000391 [Allocatelliglobosispora scoriae]|uniref:DUF1565 domain-containing protein n=1 Tax=Allocatelliglobosispora scoriae TaxID=643052 RepID=A0A841BJQ4_9ACTN|nr:right-handed parallel beta-helix repeat-containing protein [Allocatelliglobosispora scoriae]MBB5867012.1 hypothetical protein [Allocatelliglobosispora scoriae]